MRKAPQLSVLLWMIGWRHTSAPPHPLESECRCMATDTLPLYTHATRCSPCRAGVLGVCPSFRVSLGQHFGVGSRYGFCRRLLGHPRRELPARSQAPHRPRSVAPSVRPVLRDLLILLDNAAEPVV